MDFSRRAFFQALAGAAALPAGPCLAAARAYPTRPVHLVVDLPPGHGPDVLARLMAVPLSQRLGQQFVVDNKPGAAGNIGAEYVVRAAPDGYTLLAMISGNAANAALYPHLDFDFVKDIAPVAFVGFTPFVLLVNPAVPARTLAALIAYARAHPGELNLASSGAGTGPHLAFELLRMMTGIDIVHVPYRTSYLPDLLAGHVQLAFVAAPTAVPYIVSGKLHALGVTSEKPVTALPDVPPIAATVAGYEGSGWAAIGAPKGTPGTVVDSLNAAINAVVADPALKAHFVALGAETAPMRPAQLGTLMADAAAKWAKVIAFAGIKVN